MTNTERPRPYVGVSGVVSPDMEARLEATAAEVGLFDRDRMLALGVKAVHKTQYLGVENKYGPEWYPVGEDDFRGALRVEERGPRTLAVAQTYLDIEHVADAGYRREFTSRIVRRGQPWLQGLQFDMLPWHADPQMLDFLQETKEAYGLAVLLQCHKSAMEELGPGGVTNRLATYAPYLDYLLFDASHGTGQRLDVTALDGFLDAAYSSQSLDAVGMAVAGGLDGITVQDDLPALVQKYPDLSWDAEGRLHPRNEEGKRPLDMATVREYLAASASILTRD